MMSHMEWQTNKCRHAQWEKTHKTIEGLRQREREQMRTRLGYSHFYMIKQLVIWDVSNKVVHPDRSGYENLIPLSRSFSFSHLVELIFTSAYPSLHLHILQTMAVFTVGVFLPFCLSHTPICQESTSLNVYCENLQVQLMPLLPENYVCNHVVSLVFIVLLTFYLYMIKHYV